MYHWSFSSDVDTYFQLKKTKKTCVPLTFNLMPVSQQNPVKTWPILSNENESSSLNPRLELDRIRWNRLLERHKPTVDGGGGGEYLGESLGNRQTWQGRKWVAKLVNGDEPWRESCRCRRGPGPRRSAIDAVWNSPARGPCAGGSFRGSSAVDAPSSSWPSPSLSGRSWRRPCLRAAIPVRTATKENKTKDNQLPIPTPSHTCYRPFISHYA